jgi:superfamily I DNA/RNA helicase
MMKLMKAKTTFLNKLRKITHYPAFFFSFVPTEQQKAFIESDPTRNMKLIGVAGSGKTITMIKRVEHLLKTQKIKDKEALIVTFSRNTKQDIVNKLQIYSSQKFPKQNVRTLDSLAREALI